MVLREFANMFASPLPACREPSEADPAAWRFLWCPQGKASRRQWWVGHISAALLAFLGCVGAMGVLLAMAGELGVAENAPLFKALGLLVALFCLFYFAIASNVLCRRRLSERQAPHDLADAFTVMAVLEAMLMLDRFAQTLSGDAWPLPAPPHWLASGIAFLFLVSLAALVLECGVLERTSLTGLWRGRKGEWRVASSE
jgi:uncharacterized membrane protein YhaH (DUF805 family)